MAMMMVMIMMDDDDNNDDDAALFYISPFFFRSWCAATGNEECLWKKSIQQHKLHYIK